MADYGVLPQGFVRPRLPEIRQEIVELMKSKLREAGLSDNIETRPDSVIGLIIDTFAEREAGKWEMGEGVYMAMYPSTAFGISLDRAVSFTGVTRTQAERSLGYVTLYGAQGTIVPAGSQIANSSTQELWETVLPVTIGILNTGDITIVPVVQNSADYNIVIDTVAYQYTSDSTAIIGEILAGIAALIPADDFTVTNNGASIRIVPIKANTVQVSLSSNINVTSLGTTTQAQTVEFSTNGATAGQLTNIVNLIPGWERVTNLKDMIPGRLAETDAELRARYGFGVFRLGAATLPSIAPNIRQNVPNVTTVKAFENNTDVIDSIGRPPHSLHVVVAGGLDLDIAREIYRIKAAGIDTFGDTTVSFTSPEGSQTINFSRPENVYVWVRATITILIDEGEVFPFDGLQRVHDAILSTGQGIDIGEDVILQKFYCEIYKVPGIGNVDIEFASSIDPDFVPVEADYTSGNIIIESYQFAQFSDERIEVI